VELFAAIRWDRQRDGTSVRALADKYGVHRRTVRQALESAVPPERKTPARRAPVLGAVRALIDQMLTQDLSAPPKQRHTARRIFERLVDEHGAQVSYSYVSKYVRRRRPQIVAAQRARGAAEHGLPGFVPQTKQPGAEAEVDFCDVTVELAGKPTTCYLFSLRMSYSGKAVHRVFACQAQEAFLEGHVHAFGVLGGVPAGHIRYDNLTPAVVKVLRGRDRVETDRWRMFRAHYGFEAFYCEPGIKGAHEKGGVEGEGGRFRRRHFVPVPEASSLAELNERLERAEDAEDARHIAGRAASLGADFAAEAPLLLPLPAEHFDCVKTLWVRVDRYARIIVGKCRYSVPARLIDGRVRVRLAANELAVFDASTRVAEHARLQRAGDEHLELDHYLEILLRKPGALPGSTPLAQARAEGCFTATHEAFWAAARNRHGDAAGTRALIEVLLLHRKLTAAAVIAGMKAAVAAGSVSVDVVAIEARKYTATSPAGKSSSSRAADHDDEHGDGTAPTPQPRASRASVVTLPVGRRQAALPDDRRPEPSVAAYDQLLSRPPRTTARPSADASGGSQ
jgi:transposase